MPTPEQLEAFEKYDFGGDGRWLDYYNNLTIPPGRSDGAAIVRRYKQKFYQKFVDPTFEVQTLREAAQATSSSRPASSGTASSSSSAARPSPSPAAGDGGSSGPSATWYTRGAPSPNQPPPGAQPQQSAGRPGPFGLDRPTLVFLGNAWVIIMAVVAVFPITPSQLAARCFRLCLIGSLGVSIVSIVQKWGTPRSFNLEGLKLWLQNASTGPELLSVLHCLAFLPSPKPVVLAAMPLACHLAPAVALHLQQNFSRAEIYQKYLDQGCRWIVANQAQVNLFAANMEITLGFLVIVFLFTPMRNLLQIVFYWQLLKLEYHSPASAWYHRQVWAQLGAKAEPLIQRYAPFLVTPLEYAKNWFTSVGR